MSKTPCPQCGGDRIPGVCPDETPCVTHHEGCPCHEAGWRRRMAGALEEAQTERDTAAERRIERDDARAEVGRLQARVQQLGEEGRRALRERDEARSESRRLIAAVDKARDQRDEAMERVARRERVIAAALEHVRPGTRAGRHAMLMARELRRGLDDTPGGNLTDEVARLRAALEAIIAEPWLSGGRDACTIASAALYPDTPLE